MHGMLNMMRRRPISFGACAGPPGVVVPRLAPPAAARVSARTARERGGPRARAGAPLHTRTPPRAPAPSAPAEPWWHVLNALGGAAMLNWVAHKYDGTHAFMQTQLGAYAKLPTWAYDALNEEELGACAPRPGAGAGGAGCSRTTVVSGGAGGRARWAGVTPFKLRNLNPRPPPPRTPPHAPPRPADTELRQERVAAFRDTYAALAATEEAEYLAARKQLA